MFISLQIFTLIFVSFLNGQFNNHTLGPSEVFKMLATVLAARKKKKLVIESYSLKETPRSFFPFFRGPEPFFSVNNPRYTTKANPSQSYTAI
jgi:hypothetical protein